MRPRILPFALLWVALAALVWAPVPAKAQSLPEVMAGLAGPGRDAIVAAVERLAELGDPAALPALEALRDGTLRRDASGRLWVLGPDGEQARAALGDETRPAAGLTLEEPSINNRVRRSLLPVIAQLQLNSPNEALRRRSARELAERPSEDAAAALSRALEQETVADIRTLLQTAQARLDVAAFDEARNLRGIQYLAEHGTAADIPRLEVYLPTDGPALAGPEITAAAEDAVAAIERRKTYIQVVANTLYGLSLGSVLLLAALGLAITFGLMGVINMAHGEMLMLGAYATYVVQNFFATALPGWQNWYLLAAIPVAFIVTGALGMALERTIIRVLYGRPLDSLLATWGISLMLIQTVRLAFGAQNVAVANPAWLSGGYQAVTGLVLPYNRIAIVVFGFIVVGLVWALLQHTRLGLHVRAVTQNRPIAAALGVRASAVDSWTFALGSGVAGLGGVALSQIGNVGPELGQGYIVDSFMVVVLGGVGKIAGALAGAFGLGMAAKYLEPFSDAVLAKILVLTFIILFIQKRPQGIFALKGRTVDA